MRIVNIPMIFLMAKIATSVIVGIGTKTAGIVTESNLVVIVFFVFFLFISSVVLILSIVNKDMNLFIVYISKTAKNVHFAMTVVDAQTVFFVLISEINSIA